MQAPVLAFDIGGTKLAAGLSTTPGSLEQILSCPTPATDGTQIIPQLIKLGKELLGDRQPAAIGVAAAGQINIETGIVHYASDTIRNWQGLNITGPLEQAFSCRVAVDNDVNAMALAEHQFGVAQNCTNVVFVAVGTGVGGALILNRTLHHGRTWSGGELCHLQVNFDDDRVCPCGDTGHLEAYTAGPAMERRYGREGIRLTEIAARAEQGEAQAQAVITEGARILGRSLAGVMTLLDPDMLVIGGGVSNLGEIWWSPLLEALRNNHVPGPAAVVIKKAQFGSDAVLVGATCLAARP
ncbi:MAG: glucokinase [Candidatus Omnitrophota bacterium]|jgi:glucokinase